MAFNIIPVNGHSPYLNYEFFEQTIRDQIGKKCGDGIVFLLNNFPIPVSAELDIDLIMIIAIEPKDGNYYMPKVINERRIYFFNQIIPIKFITFLSEKKVSIEGRQISVENEELVDYSMEIQAMRQGLFNYLTQRCQFNRSELFVHPLIFIQNQQELVIDNCLIAPTFDFRYLHRYFNQNSADIFVSYKSWKTPAGFMAIPLEVERVVDQASLDSKVGFLTKKKLDRITKQLSSGKAIFEELNKHLIIIGGKAGTGKSSELLLLTMKCISKGKNTLYLTYNRLLVIDIARTVKLYINNKHNSSEDTKDSIGQGSVLTLHQFFYRISKSLGVLHILSETRITALLQMLKVRMRAVYDFLRLPIQDVIEDFGQLKTAVQNHNDFDIATKEVGIDFINYLQKKTFGVFDLNNASRDYFLHKKQLIENIGVSEVFLADYYGVLENTLLAIQTPEQYFKKYDIQEKFELLEVILNLKDKHLDKNGNSPKIKLSGFVEQKKRSMGGYKRKRTLFIDEAQDCHRLEKDILISIYGSDNLVVANGGKEQLIRHVELCNWEVSLAKKLNVKKYYTKGQSFRVKKTVLDFCNFVAEKYNIDLNLIPVESEDEGQLLFDFKTEHKDTEIIDLFSHLHLKGAINGCTAYESLLIILDSHRSGATVQETTKEQGTINEYGNIEDSIYNERGTWQHLNSLANKDIYIWDGTAANKSLLSFPGSNESRLIYYESCRGLEAWSVACFGLDKFFNMKAHDPDAERYLVDDMFLSNDQRKTTFAATWVLMAMTRAIDTLYIQINDRYSPFGKIVTEYLEKNNKNIREL